MQTKYKYINFTLIADTGKTTRWAIMTNKSTACIGEIKWYGAWREYCYFPLGNTVFNTGCLSDVIHFINQLASNRATNASPVHSASNNENRQGQPRSPKPCAGCFLESAPKDFNPCAVCKRMWLEGNRDYYKPRTASGVA